MHHLITASCCAPPPFFSAGYKFNIFYPDLIDKSQTPTFKIEKLPKEPGFCMIRFTAGAPYEDVAFKVVDNPWLHGRKSGYRCESNARDSGRAGERARER